MDTLDKPTVTVIGTCRVHDTLTQIEERGLVKINNGGMNTFVHSLPEIFMRLKVLNRDAEYSSNIVGLQVGVRKGVSLVPDVDFEFAKSDVVVIEISTLKSIFYSDHPLQFNEVNRHLCTPHGDFGVELRSNIDYAFIEKESQVSIPNAPFPNTLSETYRHVVSNLSPKLMDEKDIKFYLDELCNYVNKPILFVNHINIEATNGKKITSRNRLCNIIKRYCDEKNFALFEPAVLFSEHDRATLLAKDGADLAHYAKHALEIVGMEQYKKILESLNVPI